jgi:hypothetical protein
MRKVKGPPSGVSRVYIPIADNNRDDPEPVKITIKQPTEESRRQLISMIKADASPQDTLDLFQAAIEAHVTGVENYTASTGDPIIDGKNLWTHGELAFVSEIATEILASQGMSEIEKKL